MKKIGLFIIIFFSIQTAVSGQEVLLTGNRAAVKIDEYFSALARQEKFNGNVLVALGERVVLRKSYNLPANVAGLKTSPDKQLMIASVAKLFVKFAFLKLAEQRHIKLDDTLNRFLPDFPRGDKITIRHLLNHQSGLPRELTNREQLRDVTLEKIVELAKKERLQFEPGAETLYSNIGYQTLLYILSRAAPGGYENFIRKNLLRPFAMSQTYEYNYQRPTNFSTGFNYQNKKIVPADASELNKFESGRYYSTIDDLYKFGRGIFNPRLTSKTVAGQMLNERGEVVHAGAIDGYKSYFYKNTKTGLTYIFLSNYSQIPFVQITRDIPDMVAGKPYKIPTKVERVAVEVGVDILKRYVGKYVLKVDEKQKFELRLENGKLYFAQEDATKTELFPESETVFFTDPQTDDIFEFVFDEKTKTYKMFLTSEGIRLETIKSN
ncbi:MAG TPA: serine hydrolase domain-containing protein [Pyrinomonadaceae bacterium]|jgi:CubicO group peptidase (beta-lactamase class C family)